MESERPTTIAPAPSGLHSPSAARDSSHDLSGPTPSQTTMAYNCQSCVRRKIKCDRNTPLCSSCVKSKQETCIYQPPPKPRRKKRKHETVQSEDDVPRVEEDLRDRLARYERILRDNGLLSVAEAATPTSLPKGTPQDSTHASSLPWTAQRAGKLLSAPGGRTRYIDSTLWLDSGAVELQELSDQAEPDQNIDAEQETGPNYDPVSGSLLGYTHDLLEQHPSHADAMKLWAIHVRNVEPTIRILHIPTTTKMVEKLSQQPATASKAQECVLFSIYHFAVISMTDDDCVQDFGQPRASLMKKYDHALRQAFVNASWLATTDMSLFQAYILFLISMRGNMTAYDPHTFWIFTGIAVRIAQRMGLHRDGETLGLPPFETQMRRRLFWQLIPLEGFAGQHSGTGITIPPYSWDTKKPLNVGDNQIYPGMKQMPAEVKGATDMIYVLARTEMSEYYTRKAVVMSGNGPAVQIITNATSLDILDEVEDIVERKFLRYCDILNPLHFMTLIMIRSVISVVRLRNRMVPLRNHTISDVERRDLCILAQKILDSDTTIYTHPHLKSYCWQVKAFFLWDALICILTSLTKPGFFVGEELDATWTRLADIYYNHEELLLARSAIQVSAAKATLEAWMANPPSNPEPEPDFITTLRVRRNVKKQQQTKKNTSAVVVADGAATATGVGGGGVGEVSVQADSKPATSFSDGSIGDWDTPGVDLLDAAASPGIGDWVFWDQFFQNVDPTHA